MAQNPHTQNPSAVQALEYRPWTASCDAQNFLRGIRSGELQFSAAEFAEYAQTPYGPAEGFIYFITIGEPYPTHVKIGFTSGHPRKRLASLQTGCPYPMTLMGFIMGTRSWERDLHGLLFSEHASGEWFVYGDYAEAVCDGLMIRDVNEA